MGNGRGRKGTAALGAGPWRRVGLALALAAGVAVLATGLWGAATGEAAAAPAATSSLPLELQWVPVLDLSGPVLGVELWGVADPWLAYAGAGWEPEDPTDPHGYERDGLRVRVGTVLSMAPTDTLDLRAMHWPVSWVPGWDGTTGLTVRWVHLGPQHVSFGLGALVGDLWARQETTMEFLRPSTSTRFRALRASLQAPWEIAPDLLAEPKLDLVGGVASQQSGGRSGEEASRRSCCECPSWCRGSGWRPSSVPPGGAGARIRPSCPASAFGRAGGRQNSWCGGRLRPAPRRPGAQGWA
ncbi:MAG: hypothetical protein IMX02_05285 [Limnochordaceae bacterium]|nr:hypothetical protein [Limnochordaceae bacterium]